MRVVVTGATGNLGTAVVRRLADQHDLVGVVRRPPAEPVGALAAVSWVAADLADDSSLAGLSTALVNADAVVHLAWAFQPSHRPDRLEQTGVGGTRRVLDAVAASGVRHVVHLSSVGAYSPRRDTSPVREDYPTEGVPSSPYSRHKVAAERLLDAFERDHQGVTVTRMRPGIIGQQGAGSALLRYALPALAPAALLRVLPVLPLDRGLRVPLVHADDVADAVARVLETGAAGAFNLAADPVLTVDEIAAVLGAHHVHAPLPVLRAAVSAAWHARALPLDPGWIDLAGAIPVLDCSRAHEELGWRPTTDAVTTLEQVVEGMAGRAHRPTPVLRPRTWVDLAGRFVREGPISRRRRP